jgi:ADP-ribose pyrophosphatase YjhB (NUDIX family)
LGTKGLIIKNHEVLILVKPNGASDLPGGKVEIGENQIEALNREIIEETGLLTKINYPIAQWSFTKSNGLQITGITYVCEYTGGRVTLSDEHCDYFWLPRKKIGCFNPHAGWMNTSRLDNPGVAKFVFPNDIAFKNSWRYHATCKTRKCQAEISILAE